MKADAHSRLRIIHTVRNGMLLIVIILSCASSIVQAFAQRTPASTDGLMDKAAFSGKPDDQIPSVKIAAADSIEPAPKPGSYDLHLRGTTPEVIRKAFETFGLTAVISDQIGSKPLKLDCDQVDYYVAAELVRMATGTLFVPIDQARVLVVKDSKENREKFQRRLTETLFLPGLTKTELEEVVAVSRTVLEIKEVSGNASEGTVRVRASASMLEALNRTLADLLTGHNQLLIDLLFLETDKSASKQIGIQLPQSSTVFNVDTEVEKAINDNPSAVNEIVSSGEASADDTVAIAAILIEEGLVTGVLDQPFAVFGGGLTLTGITFGTVTGNLAINSSDTRNLTHAQMRVQDSETGLLKVGSRYPIETSSYTGSTLLNGTTVSSTTTPQIQYEDLGFTLKVTPRLEGSDRVSMALDLKMQALAGSSLNGIPTLTNRSLATRLTTRADLSSMIVAYVSRNSSDILDGAPGLSGKTNTDRTGDATQLAIQITPHVVRRNHKASASVMMLLPLHD